MTTPVKQPTLHHHKKSLWLRMAQCWELYLFLVPAVVLVFVFSYVPMYGIQIAFKNYKPVLGIWGSPWVGLKHFQRFLGNGEFWRIFKNTVTLAALRILFTFPAPIILALLLNETKSRFKRFSQTDFRL